jgi:cyanophycinase-like exopeptidase
MPQNNIIRWHDGRGWIILAGGRADPAIADVHTLDIEAQAMMRIARGEPIAYIWAASDDETAAAHLDSLEDLGGPTGYLVDILTEDDDTIRAQLREAGMIILGDGPDTERLRGALAGAVAEGMAQAFARECLIFGIGAGAAALGEFLLASSQKGLAWVQSGIVAPHFEQDNGQLRQKLAANPEAYGLGIQSGSALALGADGQVQVWGKGQVTVILGAKAGEALP